jgi:hypothetical protein
VALIFAGHLLRSCNYFDEITSVEKYPVAINCFLSNDSIIILYLSEYTDYQEVLPVLNDIEDAGIEYYENSTLIGNFGFILDTIEPIDENNREFGYYTLNYPGTKTGGVYSIKYNLGEQTIKASDIMPVEVPIISVDTSLLITGTGYIDVYCKITFQDDPDKSNYYSISATEQNIENVNDNRRIGSTIISSSDPFVEGFFNYNYGNLCYFSDANFNGSKISVGCLFKPEYSWDGTNFLDVQLNSISREYYLYVKSLDKYLLAKDNIFTEPVNVYSNIEGGYGIFAAYNKSLYRINLP